MSILSTLGLILAPSRQTVRGLRVRTCTTMPVQERYPRAHGIDHGISVGIHRWTLLQFAPTTHK